MISKKTVSALLVSAVALTVAGGISTAKAADAAAAAGTEKCYGVAKAGKNDCANSSKSHSCAGQAATDGDKGDFVKVATGACDKIVGGSTTDGAAAPAAAPAGDAPKE